MKHKTQNDQNLKLSELPILIMHM